MTLTHDSTIDARRLDRAGMPPSRRNADGTATAQAVNTWLAELRQAALSAIAAAHSN